MKFPTKVLKPIQDYLENQRKKLEKRKKDLEKEDPFTDVSRVNDNAAIDAEAAEEVGHERISALKNEINKSLIRIRKSLTRIKVGKYGLCTKCKKMINTDRLAIDPTVEHCMSCNSKEKENN
ncbi:TraR/DksA C4-type zinc finger protein [Patescibacteria group bacterium]